jgi:hypothetical protein
MISFSVIVSKILADRRPQGSFAKEDHSVQTFFLDRLDESLGKSVQVGRTRRKLHGLDTSFSKNPEELRGVERISIVDQVTVCFQDSALAVSHVSADLLHPETVRAPRDTSELNASRRELDEEKNHETLQAVQCPDLHGKEVCSGNLIKVSRDEFFPGRLSFTFWSGFNAVTLEDVGKRYEGRPCGPDSRGLRRYGHSPRFDFLLPCGR